MQRFRVGHTGPMAILDITLMYLIIQMLSMMQKNKPQRKIDLTYVSYFTCFIDSFVHVIPV